MSPKAGLDTAIVVKAAADLVNTAGIEALSLSRLAGQLGVQTPSLYNHIHGLPGLYRELALLNARTLEDRLSRAAVGKSGPAALMAVAQAYRAYIKESPGLYMASLRASGTQTPVDVELQAAETRIVEVALAVVASLGLQGDDALHAVRGLRSVVHGFATLEVAGGFGLPLDCDESFRRLVQMLIHGLQPPVAKGDS
ncbi:MAG: WHG domain-containing protein [Chloroflexi bacterium]|nr:WHG domain-containing protein [Chloroflexota bacterium]